MSNDKANMAVAYYKAMNNKNMAYMEKQVHSDVHFIGPLAELTGKEAYLDSVRKFFNLFKSIKIREQFGLRIKPLSSMMSIAQSLLEFCDQLRC